MSVGEPSRELCCPACGAALFELESGDFSCVGCGARYPLLGGVACLVPEPAVWRARWLGRFQDYSASSERWLAELRREGARPGLLPITRARVARVTSAVEAQRAAISERLLVLEDRSSTRALPALATGGAPEALLKCYENLFRDWVWGDAENEQALSVVARALGATATAVRRPLGRLAVYGAGAARLALEVHQRFEPEATFALDINPLPLLVARELLDGKSLILPEFPVGPDSDASFVVEQQLRAPPSPRPGFRLLFADALRPPFAPGSLDTVLTPWFIDAVDAELPQTLAAIARVLRQGGAWVQFGPLRFDGPIASRYMLEDVLELAELAGFERPAPFRESIAYFDSPFSGSRRTETVVAFSVCKLRSAAAPAPAVSSAPPWLSDPSLPIPVTPELAAAQRSAIFKAGVLSMLDGARSLQDLAGALGQKWNVPARELLPKLRALLERVAP